MMLYILTLYLLLVGSYHFVQLGSVCSSNNRKPVRRVTLSGYNNDTVPCECQITLHKLRDTLNPLNTNISITHFPVSCNDSIYWLDGNTTKVESKHENSTFNMDWNGTLYVRMENKKKIGSGDLCFNLNVITKSPDYTVAATCQTLNKNTETASITTLQSTTGHTAKLTNTFVVSQTVDNVSKQDKETNIPSSTTMSTRNQRTTGDIVKIKDDEDDEDDNDANTPCELCSDRLSHQPPVKI
ncbi:hypothetical protein LOTGIDRAFT_172881 [Lottia gigantea]|uniref:Uncharacterized protein n=1 Tax=Lottia gigantea TaxID=225164 RepID=V4AAN1_LOTGI|nr:hypothetical protein LOTGIDRAFT_172881 [Lottia gigantea]ESP01049.1 hypothetical protein LOTGIDRAFT_172881 [Lottia gigantea]